jgi:hypothetical protein
MLAARRAATLFSPDRLDPGRRAQQQHIGAAPNLRTRRIVIFA